MRLRTRAFCLLLLAYGCFAQCDFDQVASITISGVLDCPGGLNLVSTGGTVTIDSTASVTAPSFSIFGSNGVTFQGGNMVITNPDSTVTNRITSDGSVLIDQFTLDLQDGSFFVGCPQDITVTSSVVTVAGSYRLGCGGVLMHQDTPVTCTAADIGSGSHGSLIRSPLTGTATIRFGPSGDSIVTDSDLTGAEVLLQGSDAMDSDLTITNSALTASEVIQIDPHGGVVMTDCLIELTEDSAQFEIRSARSVTMDNCPVNGGSSTISSDGTATITESPITGATNIFLDFSENINLIDSDLTCTTQLEIGLGGDLSISNSPLKTGSLLLAVGKGVEITSSSVTCSLGAYIGARGNVVITDSDVLAEDAFEAAVSDFIHTNGVITAASVNIGGSGDLRLVGVTVTSSDFVEMDPAGTMTAEDSPINGKTHMHMSGGAAASYVRSPVSGGTMEMSPRGDLYLEDSPITMTGVCQLGGRVDVTVVSSSVTSSGGIVKIYPGGSSIFTDSPISGDGAFLQGTAVELDNSPVISTSSVTFGTGDHTTLHDSLVSGTSIQFGSGDTVTLLRSALTATAGRVVIGTNRGISLSDSPVSATGDYEATTGTDGAGTIIHQSSPIEASQVRLACREDVVLIQSPLESLGDVELAPGGDGRVVGGAISGMDIVLKAEFGAFSLVDSALSGALISVETAARTEGFDLVNTSVCFTDGMEMKINVPSSAGGSSHLLEAGDRSIQASDAPCPVHVEFECHPRCSTCVGTGVSDCTACGPGRFLVYDDDETGSCELSCPEGSYEGEGVCEPCHSHCSDCYGPSSSECWGCALGHQRTGDSCEPTCEGSTFSVCLCSPCPHHCDTCTESECTSCDAPFLLSDGACRVNCAADEYDGGAGECVKCDPRCEECGDEYSNCKRCIVGLFFDSDTQTCGNSCPTGTYESSSDRACLPCSARCTTCTGPSRTCA